MKEDKSLVDWIGEYLAYRRNLGFRLGGEEGELRRFARHVEAAGHRGPLTAGISFSWVQLAGSANHQHRRFETVHSFVKYVAIFEPETQIPPRALLKVKCRRPEPYIYSDEEITALLRTCDELSPKEGLRPRTYRSLFGLLAATGLRVSEALHLNRIDVDLDRGVLTVRETKFRKSRFVPVHTSTREALRRYVVFRDAYHPFPQSDTFFVSESGSALPYSTVNGVFQQLRRELGWNCGRRRLPRIHDMRHTFTCRCLLRWYEEGADVDHVIPFLSTYLGHCKVTDTYWYLTGIPELMATTARRFEQFVCEEESP